MTVENIQPQAAKISRERAQEIIQEWLDFYDIDFEDIVNDQGKEGAQTIQNKLVRAIMKGRLETDPNNEKGFVVFQHINDGKTLIYNELSGHQMIEGEKAKGSIAGMYAMLGSLCGLGSTAIKNLKGKDLGLAHAIGTIFLVV